MEDDYYGKVGKSATTFLSRWNGEMVRVRALTTSHRTLQIVVFRDYETLMRENLCLHVDPLWMCGPFEWGRAALEIDVVAAADTPAAAFTRDERLFRLRDPIGFELLTSVLSVAENVGLERPFLRGASTRQVEADLTRTAIHVVSRHPAVQHVELAGSRSRGTHDDLSDWDFAITTTDFAALARDMPALVAELGPLGEQWEPLGHFPVYQVLLPGPTKIEYLFLDHTQEASPPPQPGPATLDAINTHFWDWLWWIATKAAIGKDDVVAEHLQQLFGHLLRPIGVTDPPADLQAAIDAFVSRRDALEREYDVIVSRALELEVQAGVRRLGLAS